MKRVLSLTVILAVAAALLVIAEPRSTSASGLWGTDDPIELHSAYVSRTGTCSLGPYGPGDWSRITVSDSGQVSLYCQAKLDNVSPPKADVFYVTCGIRGQPVSGQVVITPSGIVMLKCHGWVDIDLFLES